MSIWNKEVPGAGKFFLGVIVLMLGASCYMCFSTPDGEEENQSPSLREEICTKATAGWAAETFHATQWVGGHDVLKVSEPAFLLLTPDEKERALRWASLCLLREGDVAVMENVNGRIIGRWSAWGGYKTM